MQIPSQLDRGATLVEYALGIGLVVVVSLGVLNALEANSSERLDERSSASGASAEISGAGYSYGGGGGTGGTSTDGTDDDTPAVTTIDGVSIPSSKASRGNPKSTWIVNVTLVVTSGGDKIEGALAEVTFDLDGSPTTVSCPDSSNKKGEVECELAGISGSISSVTVTVQRIYGSNIEYSAPTPAPQITLSRPSNVEIPK